MVQKIVGALKKFFSFPRMLFIAFLLLVGVLIWAWFPSSFLKPYSGSDEERTLPGKYYVKTLQGFEFSDSPGFHPLFGARFKPLDESSIAEYRDWHETGALLAPPFNVNENCCFYDGGGAPKAWYARREVEGASDVIKLSPLPGYDPITGKRLRQVTEDLLPLKKELLECYYGEGSEEGVNGFILQTSSGPLSLRGAQVILNVQNNSGYIDVN